MNRIFSNHIISKYKRSITRPAMAGFFCATLLMVGVLAMNQLRSSQEELAARLSPGILRLHILANSDSADDQEVKLEVRSLMLDYLSDRLPDSADKTETVQLLQENSRQLEQAATTYLHDSGFPYSAVFTLARDYFPTRVYDGMVIPCGFYDAVRITLGKGDGHNWWCVLYPKFCFVDAVHSEVPERSRKLLLQTLKQDDVPRLEDHRPVLHPDMKIRLLLFPRKVPQNVTQP